MRAWSGLALVYLAFMCAGFVFHFVGPILPEIIADLDLSHGQAGLLMSMFALPGIVLAWPGGRLVDRFGDRTVAGAGLVLLGAGAVAVAWAPSFLLVMGGRVVSGVGVAVGVVALQRRVVRLFAGRPLGLPMGVSGSALPLGIIVVLNSAAAVAAADGWRAVPLRVGLGTLVVSAVFWILGRWIDRGRGAAPAATTGDDGGAPFARVLVLTGAAWFCANGAMTAFLTFAPDHYLDLGLGLRDRGLVTSLPMWLSAGLGTLTGWICDRFGGRPAMIAGGMLVMAAGLLLAPGAGTPPLVVGTLLGIALAAVVTPLLSLVGEVVPPARLGAGFGLLAACASLGIAVVPPAAGYVRDLTGAYDGPFVLMAVVAAIGAGAAEILRRGRSAPGFALRAAAMLVLLLAVGAGCGRQDRYEIGSPSEEIMASVAGAEFRTLPGLLFSNGVRAADGWDDGGYAVAASNLVLRRSDDGWMSLPLPLGDSIRGLACRSDGGLVCVTANGWYCEHDGTDWTIEVIGGDETAAGRMGGLVLDEQDRPLVFRTTTPYAVLRREDGAWRELEPRPEGVVVAAWSHPVQGVHLATLAGRILRVDDDGLTVLGEGMAPVTYSGEVSLAGDGAGRLAVKFHGDDLWLFDGAQWTPHRLAADQTAVGDLFWHDGRLTGLANNSLWYWDGDEWIVFATAEQSRYGGRVIFSGGEPLVVRDDARIEIIDGDRLMTAVAPQGVLTGVTRFRDRWWTLTNQGQLWSLADDGSGLWRQEISGPEGDFIYSSALETLHRDGSGALVIIDETVMHRLDGEVWTSTGFESWVNWAGRSGDALVMVSDDRLYIFDDGVLTEHAAPWRIREPRAALLTEDGELLLLDGRTLYRVLPGALEPVWSAVGWTPRSLANWRGGVLVAGYEGVRWLNGDEVVDLTPLRRKGRETVQASLHPLEVLDDERLLGWDSEEGRFCLYDGTWSELATGLPVGAPTSSWNTSFSEMDGHLVLHGNDGLMAIDLGGVR